MGDGDRECNSETRSGVSGTVIFMFSLFGFFVDLFAVLGFLNEEQNI